MYAASTQGPAGRTLAERTLPPVCEVSGPALLEIARAATGTGGCLWIRVTGKSMNPLIRHGDRVLVAPLRAPARVGQIVLLDSGGAPLLHRIVDIDGGWLITRGDSRRSFDPRLPAAAVLGRVMAVRRGDTVLCVAATFSFGLLPLLRGCVWGLRMQVARWQIRQQNARRNAA